MRETRFIEQNEKKWRDFEQALDGQERDPEKLNELFVQITDDLSYSRTFYPNRSVRVYLNQLGQRIFLSLYNNQKTHRGRFLNFWKSELPQLVYEARQEFRLAFGIFVLFMLIGVLSSVMDSNFAAVILGEDYVQMTLENIESGDPMAVYKDKGKYAMWLGITANNLYVAFLTFVMGIFASIGSIFILIQNAIMVGAFQYFFIEKGLFWESFLSIWIHGALEISAIVIAGAAGITMGKGWLFPGTFTRLQAFRRSARRGIKIMLGITPLILMAGFFEAYLTRHTDAPDVLRLLFILICFGFVLGYFVWYPVWLAKRGFPHPLREFKLPPERPDAIRFDRIKNAGTIFSEVFQLYKSYFPPLFWSAFGAAVLYTVLAFTLTTTTPAETFVFEAEDFASVLGVRQFFQNPQIFLLPLIFWLAFWIPIFVAFTFVMRRANLTIGSSTSFAISQEWRSVAKVVLGTGALYLVLRLPGMMALYAFPFLFPVILLWMFVMYNEQLDAFKGLSRTFGLLRSAFWSLFVSFLILTSIAALFLTLLDSVLSYFFLQMVELFIVAEQQFMDNLSAILLTLMTVLLLQLTLIILALGVAVSYYSLVEILEAGSLRRRIARIGSVRKIKGMERE